LVVRMMVVRDIMTKSFVMKKILIILLIGLGALIKKDFYIKIKQI